MSSSLVHRLLHPLTKRSQHEAANLRIESRPPVARRKGEPWHRRLHSWLTSGYSDRVSTLLQDWQPKPRDDPQFRAARQAFRDALHDIDEDVAATTLVHLRSARSMHELWHLRTEVFSLVSCHLDQHEATRRLALVDRHFEHRVRRTRYGAARRA